MFSSELVTITSSGTSVGVTSCGLFGVGGYANAMNNATTTIFLAGDQATYNAGLALSRSEKKGISPNLYFSYVKSKFGFLQRQPYPGKICWPARY